MRTSPQEKVQQPNTTLRKEEHRKDPSCLIKRAYWVPVTKTDLRHDMSLWTLRSRRKNSDPIRFRKNKTAHTHRIQYWCGTALFTSNDWKLKQWRSAFKILEENNFRPVTTSHAKILRGKEMFRYPWPQKTYLPCTLARGRPCKICFINTRVWTHTMTEVEKGGPEQHESHVWGQKETGCKQSTKCGWPPVHPGAASEGSQEDFSKKVTWISCLLYLSFGKGLNNLCEFWLNKL